MAATLSTHVQAFRTQPLDAGRPGYSVHAPMVNHAKRAVALYLHSESLKDPWTFVKSSHWQPQRKQNQRRPIGPALYDTAFSREDGKGIQRGWGGRSR